MTEIKNKVQYVEISSLTELENNPRTIKKDRFEKLKKSIQENKDYFEGRPVLVNEVGGKRIIFAGNQRYKAAKALGWTEVPAVIYQNLPEEKQRELTIRDNVELGDWDFDILANEFDIEDLQEWGLEDHFKTGLADEKEIEEREPTITSSFITFEYSDDIELKITNETAERLMSEMIKYREEHGNYDGFWDERLKNE